MNTEAEPQPEHKTKGTSLSSLVAPLTVLTMILLVLSLPVVLFYNNESMKTAVLFSSGSMLFIIVMTSIFAYLSPNRTTVSFKSSLQRENMLLREEINRFVHVADSINKQLEVSEKNTSLWTESDRNRVVEQLNRLISETVTEDFTKSIEKAYGEQIFQQENYRILSDIFETSKNRLQSEIEDLTRRSTINLVIGIATTIVAIVILTLVVFMNHLDSTSFGQVLVHFLPRLSLVIFVEVFSFFFLQLYKSSLSDIKYYQNEITAIESRQIALISMHSLTPSEFIQPLLIELIKIDRNQGFSGHSVSKTNKANIKDLEGLIGKISDLAGKVSN